MKEDLAVFLREAQDALRKIAENGCARALDDLRDILRNNILGGTQLAYRVSLRFADCSRIDLVTDYYLSGTPDPEGGKYDYEVIADQKHESTMDSGLTVREMLRRGMPTRTPYHGNTTTPLDEEATVLLVVSCSGLREMGDEAASEKKAANIKTGILAYEHAFNK